MMKFLHMSCYNLYDYADGETEGRRDGGTEGGKGQERKKRGMDGSDPQHAVARCIVSEAVRENRARDKSRDCEAVTGSADSAERVALRS